MIQRDIEEIRREVKTHNRVLFGNSSPGLIEKVTLIWDWYLARRKMEAAIFILLVGNFLLSIAGLLRS